jgi:hypothetical protein
VHKACTQSGNTNENQCKSVLSNIKEAKKSPTIGYWYMSQNGASVHGGASLVLPNKSVSDGVIKLRSDEEVLEMFDR